ncbi:MAG TPA: hypothetical protein VIU62_16850 [Chloroflexota bacterium]
MSWGFDYEMEPPSYGGEMRRMVEYVTECFNCNEERYDQSKNRRQAEQAARGAGWKLIDPDGWCCAECLPTLRRARQKVTA